MVAIKNITLEGTGVRLPAEVGVMSVLESNGTLSGVENIAGVSAGAITATLYALRYTSAEIKVMIDQTDFSQFKDGIELINDITAYHNYGLHPGKVFLKYIEDKIAAKYGNPLMTFADLKAAGGLNLVIYADKPFRNVLRRFSYADTPIVPIEYAVRASMSIPGFFQAWYFPDGNPDKDTYVDGGTTMDYPIHAFDDTYPAEATIGICFEDKSGILPDDPGPGHPFKFIRALAENALSSQDIDEQQNLIDQKRSIVIDTLGISATDFGITQTQKEALFQAGVSAANKFFAPKSVS